MAIIQHEAAYENATKRAILANARKTWLKNTPRAEEIETALVAGRLYDHGQMSYTEDFIGAMARSLDTYGKLTEKQCAAIIKGIEARAARKAEWADKQAALNATRQHLGTVGEKITLALTIKRKVHFDTDFGSSCVCICEDADGNVVIYKGTSAVFMWNGDDSTQPGDVVTVTAKVASHGVREGVKQTVIQRPKKA